MKKVILAGYTTLVLSIIFMIAVSVYFQMFYLSIGTVLWCIYVTNTLIKLDNPTDEKLSSSFKTFGFMGGINFVMLFGLIPIYAFSNSLNRVQLTALFLSMAYPLLSLYYLIKTLKYFKNHDEHKINQFS